MIFFFAYCNDCRIKEKDKDDDDDNDNTNKNTHQLKPFFTFIFRTLFRTPCVDNHRVAPTAAVLCIFSVINCCKLQCINFPQNADSYIIKVQQPQTLTMKTRTTRIRSIFNSF